MLVFNKLYFWTFHTLVYSRRHEAKSPTQELNLGCLIYAAGMHGTK